MKKIFALALAAAAMVSCTNDEVIGLNQEAIGFDNAFIDNATRSIDPSITKETLSSFQVYGTTKGNEDGAALVSIFDYVTVEDKAEATNAWDWQYAANYTQYWIADNIYNFAALKNAAEDKVALGADLLPETVTFTADGATDLLYAKSATYTGLASSNPKVDFTFEHLLSKVQFTVKNTMTNNTSESLYQYRVSDVQINNAYTTATCTVATKVWDTHTDAGMVDFGHVTAENATENVAIAIGKVGEADEATSRLARLLVPATYTALNITCTIETLLNGSVVDVLNYDNDIEITLAPGSAYNFVISKGNPGEQILFSVTEVNGWDNGNTADANGDGVKDNVPL